MFWQGVHLCLISSFFFFVSKANKMHCFLRVHSSKGLDTSKPLYLLPIMELQFQMFFSSIVCLTQTVSHLTGEKQSWTGYRSSHRYTVYTSWWKKVGIQTFTIYSKMSQIVIVTDVIMWRSKWVSGIWQPESSRMAEQWEVLSGGKKKKKLNDLWAGSIILSSVIPLGPASLFRLSSLSLLLSVLVILSVPLLSVSSSSATSLSSPPSVCSAHVVWLT